ncbi:MAG: hypothetical protein ACO294_13040 [Methylococcales bacterium]
MPTTEFGSVASPMLKLPAAKSFLILSSMSVKALSFISDFLCRHRKDPREINVYRGPHYF